MGTAEGVKDFMESRESKAYMSSASAPAGWLRTNAGRKERNSSEQLGVNSLWRTRGVQKTLAQCRRRLYFARKAENDGFGGN